MVSDGLHQVAASTTLLDRPDDPAADPRPARRPHGSRGRHDPHPAAGQRPRAATPLTFSSDLLPGGAFLDPNTGVFDWTPDFVQHGVSRSRSPSATAASRPPKTTTITVLNVNAAPVFDDLDDWRVQRGPGRPVPRLRLRPGQPGLRPAGPRRRRHADPAGRHPRRPSPTPPPACRRGPPSTRRRRCSTGRPATPPRATYLVTFTATDDGDGTGTPLVTTVTVPDHRAQHQPARQRRRHRQPGDGPRRDARRRRRRRPTPTATRWRSPSAGLPRFATFIDHGDGTGAPRSPGPRRPRQLHDQRHGHRQRRRRRPDAVLSATPHLRPDGQLRRTSRRTSARSATRSPSSASR